jgi:hypothetical protein
MVAEYQITYWQELPSLVVARDGEQLTKYPLAQRFQDAIDEAAMRLGETGSDAYLAGWRRTAWCPVEGGAVEAADVIAARLEQEWTPEAVTAFLDSLGPAVEEAS